MFGASTRGISTRGAFITLAAIINSLISILLYIQNGWTTLHIASLIGHFKVIKVLLEANADVNIKTNVSRVLMRDNSYILCV